VDPHLADTPRVTIEHQLRDGVGRLRLLGDLVGQRDVNLLIVIVGDYCQNANCSAIEIDFSLVWKISPLAVGAISALGVMAEIHTKALTLTGSHGKVRTDLQREGVLHRDEGRYSLEAPLLAHECLDHPV